MMLFLEIELKNLYGGFPDSHAEVSAKLSAIPSTPTGAPRITITPSLSYNPWPLCEVPNTTPIFSQSEAAGLVLNIPEPTSSSVLNHLDTSKDALITK